MLGFVSCIHFPSDGDSILEMMWKCPSLIVWSVSISEPSQSPPARPPACQEHFHGLVFPAILVVYVAWESDWEKAAGHLVAVLAALLG